ncbi:flagellar hook-length control protein FliK [Bosea sp. BH3]|uniref:flagellar hook-length control protein FliK n=1 Tax=Bosea sp. BH3 TaxID=2871701 RepID=UPI0021CB5547|nr:flagellar hook-length control protein FliK [Bosea sp. BH3]MCU4180792.1 flagellar hook-length control protein FliK [Bosea sp. BH3]
MNIAQLVQSKTLATLLQALDISGELPVGRTVQARLLMLDADGTATAMIGETKVALVLAGPQARQAALEPGTTLMLRLDAPAESGGELRATLVETRPPAAAATAATPQAATAQAAATAPDVPTPAAARALAGPMLASALQQQDSLAPLLANLRSLARGEIVPTLPKELLTAVNRVLAQAVPGEQPMTARQLREAFQSSGLFLEAQKAAGLQPQRDLKAGLQGLREALIPIIDALAPATKIGAQDRPALPTPDGRTEAAPDQASRPAPPRRDGPLLPQAPAEPTLSPGEKTLAIAETLLDQTDSALDRIRLTQYASLPLESARQDTSQPAQRWLAEVPIAFQNGATVLPMQVERDAPRRTAQGVSPPLWRIRFALDVEPIGPLQGIITLQGREVGVTLWAEREDTSRILRGAAPGLESALLAADFAGGAVDVHTGQPRVAQPTAGQFLDRLS